ncbi:hypothetical protein ACP70R_036943 [Stipagrostis hirtigluma subsp. patula]
MANPMLENPIVVALLDELHGRLDDVDAVQQLLDDVRVEMDANAAEYAEAADQLAQARRRLAEALFDAAARRALSESESKEEEEEEVERVLADPEVHARMVAYAEAGARVERVVELDGILVQALAFLVVARATAFAATRAPLLPGVLLTAVAAYALAYAASGGAVAPGPASLLRIAVLVLCFLFGFWG